MSAPLSIRETYAGKHLLLTGATGFLGKVWLCMLLERVPEVGRVYVLLRPKALVPPSQRFEKMVNGSAAFAPLHQRYGADLSAFLDARVTVIDGDVSEPGLGLTPAIRATLEGSLDLIVHCAGLVDFNPDLRKGLSANVHGTAHVAELASRCRKAGLMHVSTCYVAGTRQGFVEERVYPDAPNGTLVDVEAEIAESAAAIVATEKEHASDAFRARLAEEAAEIVHERRHNGSTERLIASMTQRMSRERLKTAMVDLGEARAQKLGFVNAYTYTKALAEHLLVKRYPKVPTTILRPSIVESAMSFPVAGWNQGFNTSAPIVYAMGTWFRAVPAKPDVPFDVIPVDLLCNGMMIAGAALIKREHRPVYQAATSERNRLTVGRVCELIDLGHRRHYRVHGKTTLERAVLSRWDATMVDAGKGLTLDRMRDLAADVGHVFANAPKRVPLRWRERADKVSQGAKHVSHKLDELHRLMEMYRPFMHDSFTVFVARALNTHQVVEPEFQFDPMCIQWRSYWIDVHMPGIRRWAFPLFEGKSPPSYRAPHPVKLQREAEPSRDANVAGASRETPDQEPSVRPKSNGSVLHAAVAAIVESAPGEAE